MADGLSIEMETKEVEKMVSRLLKKVKRPTKLLLTLERIVNAVTKKMFRGRRPDNNVVRGQRWPKLKEETIKQKRAKVKRGKAIATRPMVETGALRDSLKVIDRSSRGFSYGTNKRSKKGFPYPAHQNQRFPWLFLRKQDYLQFEKATVDFLKDSLKNFKSYISG